MTRQLARTGAILFSITAGILVGASPSHAAVTLPGSSTKLEKIDFERHVMGLFGRTGCNSGSCHGSFQGKGGFRLSLFGYDPEKDYQALTREVLGRRINAANPDDSLLLLKAIGHVPHGGGTRFSKGSWQYEIFRQWIAEGARWQSKSGEVVEVNVNPPEQAFKKAEESKQLQVLAKFSDGSTNDITPFCDFRTNDDAVADVTRLGQVTSLRPGSTAIIVIYRGNVVPVRILVPAVLPAGVQFPKTPEMNYIDTQVFSRLRQLNMIPADLADDTEFLRRLYIDTIGTLPTPDDVRAFLASKDAQKRSKKIDELLAHPMHAALWATKWCDITGNDTTALEQPQQIKPKLSQLWHDWFRKRFLENMPYDQIVRGVLCATSRDGQASDVWYKDYEKLTGDLDKGFDTSYADRDSLDLFWRRQQQVLIEQWGEKTAAAFMGIRVECAQCHKHPFDRWTQAEYRAYANIFGQVAFGISPETKKQLGDKINPPKKDPKNKNQSLVVKEVYLASTAKSLPHPDTNGRLSPKALGGPEIKIEDGKDARVALFEWLRSPENPFFARSFVNRAWGHYLGVGLVDPVDDFSLANPASNQKLLDALAKDFVDHKFDIRHIERTILNSRTYQLSSRTNETNKLDKKDYSHSYIRPMMAEVVVDVLNAAMGIEENFGQGVRPNIRAIEVGPSVVQNPTLAFAFRVFGRPPRTVACDCERASEPGLPQKLFLMTDTSLLGKLQSGRLQKLLQTKMDDDQVLEELFLATVSRFPTQDEKQRFTEYRTTVTDRRAAFFDTLWALINTREFILNH